MPLRRLQRQVTILVFCVIRSQFIIIKEHSIVPPPTDHGRDFYSVCDCNNVPDTQKAMQAMGTHHEVLAAEVLFAISKDKLRVCKILSQLCSVPIPRSRATVAITKRGRRFLTSIETSLEMSCGNLRRKMLRG